MALIGSHATVTGGLATGGLAYAAEVGAEVIQVFVSSPRGWAAGLGDPAQDRALRESGIPVFIHAPYLINLGSGDPSVAEKSADAVAYALRRGGEIGARGVVVHTGSAAGGAEEPGGAARERALRHRAVPRTARHAARYAVRGRNARREDGARAGHRYPQGTALKQVKGAHQMVVVMAADATASDVDHVVTVVNEAGGEAFASRGESRTIIGISGDLERFAAALNLAGLPGVADVVRISVPYKLVSREHRRERSVIKIAGVPIGPDTLTVIAGPCAVETHEQTLQAARMARAAGASLLRGGAYKPRSSPYAFQGLGEAGLKILADVRAETGLPIVTEVVDSRDVDLVASYADMLQVGTRNMANFPLLQAVGAAGKPVMLKRGMSATIEEWLMAAEYIAQRGNLDIVLCERGIRTFETATRNTLDIAAVPIVQRLSHLPVIVDPSHSGGRRDLVLPLSRAAIAIGADGIIVDVHPHPETALCDGPQALIESDLRELASVAHHFSPLVGRTLTPAPAPHA